VIETHNERLFCALLCIATRRFTCKLKMPPHKQHIWFLPTLKPNAEKPKELFFAFALENIVKRL
ncbi:hypothetical protein, partial [Mesohalobacter salilacus]|uniref:hypothetical protein n=1 Tax=Mesohalobacter salilacus TaxID=2491711 RepID=UPI00403ED5D6